MIKQLLICLLFVLCPAAAHAGKNKEMPIEAKGGQEQIGVLCKEQRESILDILPIGIVLNLIEFFIADDLDSLQPNGLYKICGTVVSVFDEGIAVDIGGLSEIFVYTSDAYYDGQNFEDSFLYKYTGSYTYSLLGIDYTVPAFVRTQQAFDED